MSQSVVILAGSPSATSRSALVAGALASELERAGLRRAFFSVTDFDAADVLLARATSPTVGRFVDEVRASAAIVLATPVYKAVYAGALKAIVDLIPPEALDKRPALGIATARLPAHGATVDAAFQSLFAFFGARPLPTLFLLDGEVQASGTGGVLSALAEQRVRGSAADLVAALEGASRRP